MTDSCTRFGRTLEFYAEGELNDPAAVERVRVHLRHCDHCREFLMRYDALTGALLRGELDAWDEEAGVAVDDSPLWERLERERRVDGILKRLTWSAPAPLVADEERPDVGAAIRAPAETTSSSSRSSPSRSSPSRSSRGRASGEGPSRVRSSGERIRSGALAAAILVGVVSVWVAVQSGGQSGIGGRAGTGEQYGIGGRDDSRSREVVFHVEPTMSGRDTRLRWVVAGVGAKRPHQLVRSKIGSLTPTRRTRSGRTLLYGVTSDRQGGPRRAAEWVVQVVLLDPPPRARGGSLDEPRYLLVPEELDESETGARPLPFGKPLPAGVLWFEPEHAHRRRGNNLATWVALDLGGSQRAGGSTVYQVCVYESSPRLGLPPRAALRGARWDGHGTFTRIAGSRARADRLLTGGIPAFLESWPSVTEHEDPRRRY